ncbi:HlyD family secretion protein [Acidocella sp.]|uniref:HlyD family secretion protein n=1 Tax=Acidocella sp. TaxID=50710 RepID=UPI00261A7E37|nr:HlyD family secretion protein [Acidocella sp.]
MAEQGEEKDKQDDEAKHEPGKREEEDNKPRSKWPLIIAGIAVVVLVIAGLIYWLVTRGEVTTEDAYTDGRSISLATNTSGYVTALYVDDNTFVHKGDLLMIVDPRTNDSQLAQAKSNLLLAQANLASAQTNLQIEEVRAPAQLTQAQAQLEQAQAQLANARRNYNRQVSVNQRATAATDIDQATEQLRTASAQVKQAEANLAVATLVQQNIETAVQQVAQREAQLAQAQANLKSAEVALSYNYIRAPQDGWITMRNVELGTYLQSGAQVFYIVVPQTWIVANFKETQLNGMRVGQKVTISVDAFPALKLRGHVQSMQQGSGAVFSAFPAENATGNFVKIVRRVPVKIVIDSGLPASLPMLPLGISVEPTVHER